MRSVAPKEQTESPLPIKKIAATYQAEQAEEEVVEVTAVEQVLEVSKAGREFGWQAVGWPEGRGILGAARLSATRKFKQKGGRPHLFRVLVESVSKQLKHLYTLQDKYI